VDIAWDKHINPAGGLVEMRRSGTFLQTVKSIANKVLHHVTERPAINVSTLSVLKDLVLPVAVYLYFTGFLYTYYFYSGLGIPLNSVEIPFYYFFIYSYNVIAAELTTSLLLLFSALLTILVIRTRKHPDIGLFLVLSALFPILTVLSRDAATTQIGLLRTGRNLQTIQLILKDVSIRDDELLKNDGSIRDEEFLKAKANAEQERREFLIANANDGLKLVVETTDRLYVLRQPFDERNPEIPVGSLYGISKSDVLVANVSLLNIPKPGGE
jgi:hypothetical protein